jgi:hypothetical protein
MSYTHMRPDGGSTISPPHWVKVFGSIARVLLFAILHLTTGGPSPGSHTPPRAHGVQQL